MDQEINTGEITFWDFNLWTTAGSWNVEQMPVLAQC